MHKAITVKIRPRQAYSAVSCEFVQPLYPSRGQAVRISLKAARPWKAMRARVSQGGLSSTYDLVSEKDGYWGCSFILNDEMASWFFELSKGECVYYLGSDGLQDTVPNLKRSFIIKADYPHCPWVSEGTCYQIFPDRFKKSLDKPLPSFSFDGHQAISMNWGDIPLDYEKGHCLDFFQGDLKGIADSIEHFKALGATALYLNPIGSSRTTHRYDCTDFFSIDEKLGGDEAYISLVKALHRSSMHVITDISINHTGIDNPWFRKANGDKNAETDLDEATCRSFYFSRPDGSFDCWASVSTLPQLNYNSALLRKIIYKDKDSVLRRYLKMPYCQDAWRLDVASELGKHDDQDLCFEVWREVRKSLGNDVYLLGENWESAEPFLQGDMWSSTMNYYGISRPLRRFMGEQDRFQAQGWGHAPSQVPPFSCRQLARALANGLEAMPPQAMYNAFNLIDSHDTPRLHNHSEIFSLERYKTAVSIMYLMPGMPSTYYGDEIGLDGRLGSVEASRYCMQWDRSKWNMDFYEHYCMLGKLRHDFKDILSYGTVDISCPTESTMILSRSIRSKSIALLVNQGSEDVSFVLGKTYREVPAGCSAIVVSE